MRLQKYLAEGISDIVYHSTYIERAGAILKMDKFKLSTSIGTDSEEHLATKGKFFFFSTTRNKLGGYSLSPSDGQVMFVLDGRMLSNNYSGAPVDYWGPEFRKIQPASGEAEDRIYHTKPYIENASKYIKEIHVLLPKGLEWQWADQADQRNRYVRELYKLALQKKIQIFFYDDKKFYLLQAKTKAIDVDVQRLKSHSKKEYRREYGIDPHFDHWEEMFYIDNIDKLSKRAKDIVWRINGARAGDFYFQDYLRGLEASIHNSKSDPTFTAMLVKMFKKAKVTSAKGFLLYLANKWGKILKDD